jgi:hypothetical protein
MTGSIAATSESPLGYMGLDPFINPPFITANRPPTINDVQLAGTQWEDRSANPKNIYETTGSGLWALSGSSTSALNTLTGGSGGVITPSSGNINILGTANQIASVGSSPSITLSLIGPYAPTTYTAHGVLVGEGSSSIVATAAGTNGQVLLGSTGADPVFATLTSTDGSITFTPGAGTLNLSASLTTDLASPPPIGNVAPNTGAFTALTSTGTLNLNATGAAVSTIGTGGTGAVHIGNATGNTQVTGSLTTSTTLTATLGAITASNGNLVMSTAGNKLLIPATSSATCSAGTFVLSGAATTVVSNAVVTASSLIFFQVVTLGTVTTASTFSYTKIAGTSFTVTPSASTDTSTVQFVMIN